jgi:hypothetical protein
MIHNIQKRRRRGAVLPIVTVCLVGLMGFIALAIDIGMIAVARTQCQSAADIAALAGARTLDGKSVNNNSAAAVTMAQNTATANAVLGTEITAAQVTTCQVGIYRYDSTAGRFTAVFGQSPGTNESYGLMQVTIWTQNPTFFAGVLGVSSLNVGATSTAVHRPRDLSLVLDFSGSMGYSSHHNYNYTQTQSLNPDPNFPQFGPWSVFGGPGMVMDINNPGSPPANLQTWTPPTPMQRVWPYVDSTGYLYAANNHTMATSAGPAIVDNFLLSDNSTNAFSNKGSFPSFTNVNVSTSGNPTYVVTPAPSTFTNQSATGFVGDPFPLRFGQSVSGTTAPTSSQYAHTDQGYLTGLNTGATNATVNPIFEAMGYDWDFTANQLKAASQRFQGFTMGPGYFGKTFYMWPPDPRTPLNNIGDAGYVAGDWRRRFFLPRTGSGQNMSDNSVFWVSTGRWKPQNPGSSANYMINYDALLAWIARGPQTLPASLRSGRVVYYDTIPTTIPVDNSTGLAAFGATNDQRFWKDYIDYVIGAGRWTDSNSLYGAQSANSNTGGGSTVYYNTTSSNLTPQITPRSSLVSAALSHPITGATKASPIVITSVAHGLVTGNTVNVSGVGGNTAANGTFTITAVDANSFSLNGTTGNAAYTLGGSWTIIPYMNYGDNPVHPRAQFWFGPTTMLAYLQEPGNWLPGTCYEAQCWQLKVGINAAINDIKSNHPNDLASVIFFSGSDGYATARVPMSKNYNDMQNCLFYPFSLLASLSSSTSSIHPFSTTSPTTGNPAGLVDITDTEVPNAGTWTCPELGFEVAYNQFTNATDSATSTTYTGRKTASKVVIYETDGMPNTICNGTLTSTGGYHYTGIGGESYVTLSTTLHVTPKDNARAVVRQICASTTASPPGFSTSRNPARVHAIAFGDLFESYSTSSMKPGALRFLCAVQIDGNTSPTPSGSWDNDTLDYNAYYLNLEPWKLITGDYNTRINNIQQALQRIMQGGVQVALIQ